MRIFDRLGFDYVIVAAMSGAMGGSASEEFLATARSARTPTSAARTATTPRTSRRSGAGAGGEPYDDLPAAHVEDTPDTPTIETLVNHLNAAFPRDDRAWTAADTLKNVIVTLRAPGRSPRAARVGVPGDREVDLKRLGAQVEPAEVEPFDEADFAKNPALVKGYIGPGALGTDERAGIRYLLDPRVVTGTAWVTGADEPGRHVSTWSPAATSPPTV